MDPALSAQKAMEERGFVAVPIMDGKIHRFDVEGKKLAGWYCFHGDGVPAGSYGSWISGEKYRWCEKGEPNLNPVERADFIKKLELIKSEREQLQKSEQESAAIEANQIWNGSPIAESHEYLSNKKIKPHGVRVHKDGRLIVPAFGVSGDIQSLQFVDKDGSKLFLPGGKISGGYYFIPGDGTVAICEGFATGASIHEATGFSVFVAFNAGNLKPVSKLVKSKNKGFQIIICCDNDLWTKGNPGIIKGIEAARSIKAPFVYPVFKNTSSKPTDFNDLMTMEGPAQVKNQISSAILPSIIPRAGNKKIHIDNVYTSDRMVDTYLQYIKTLKDNRFLTGIENIDKRIRGVSGGEVLTIIARAGSFKTAMLQNMLLNYVNHSAWAAVFFSLEMPVSSVTERYMGITMGYEGREVENTFLDFVQTGNHADEIDKLRQDFNVRMKRIFVVPVKVSLSDISAYVKLIEAEFCVKVGSIGIDYMGLIDCEGKDEYQTMSKVARESKETAKTLNIPTIILCQTSRKGGEGEEEITLDAARGSGAIEEGADFVLGLWQNEIKNGIGQPTGNYDLICRILKNRKGPKGSRWKLDVNPKDFTFGEDSSEFIPVEAVKFKKQKKER